MALGAGHYVSDGKVWRAGMRPLHVPVIDEKGHMADSIAKNPDGTTVLILDPSAKKSIEQTYGAGATEAPVLTMPEDVKDKKFNERMDRLESAISTQANSLNQLVQLFTLMAQKDIPVLGAKKAAPPETASASETTTVVPEKPKGKPGRPRKEKP